MDTVKDPNVTIDLGTDPRAKFPGFSSLPKHRSWVDKDREGNLTLVEARKDPKDGRVYIGRFAL